LGENKLSPLLVSFINYKFSDFYGKTNNLQT